MRSKGGQLHRHGLLLPVDRGPMLLLPADRGPMLLPPVERGPMLRLPPDHGPMLRLPLVGGATNRPRVLLSPADRAQATAKRLRLQRRHRRHRPQRLRILHRSRITFFLGFLTKSATITRSGRSSTTCGGSNDTIRGKRKWISGGATSSITTQIIIPNGEQTT